MPTQKSKNRAKPKKNGGPKTTTIIEEPEPVTEAVVDESGALDILMSDRAILQPIYAEVDFKSHELVQVQNEIIRLQDDIVEATGRQHQIVGNLEGFNTVLTTLLTKIAVDNGLSPEEYRIDRGNWKLIKKPIK